MHWSWARRMSSCLVEQPLTRQCCSICFRLSLAKRIHLNDHVGKNIVHASLYHRAYIPTSMRTKCSMSFSSPGNIPHPDTFSQISFAKCTWNRSIGRQVAWMASRSFSARPSMLGTPCDADGGFESENKMLMYLLRLFIYDWKMYTL